MYFRTLFPRGVIDAKLASVKRTMFSSYHYHHRPFPCKKPESRILQHQIPTAGRLKKTSSPLTYQYDSTVYGPHRQQQGLVEEEIQQSGPLPEITLRRRRRVRTLSKHNTKKIHFRKKKRSRGCDQVQRRKTGPINSIS